MVNDQSMTKHENNAILNPDMDKREYKITIGIRSYWITKEELEKYLAERKVPGVDLVALRGGTLFLPAQCQEIAHRSVIDDSAKIEGGRWQCEKGNWHANGNDCRCSIELLEGEDGIIRIQEKNDRALPEPVQAEKPSYPASRYLGVQLKTF